MSWVEDARKLMQDFVAPELRAISARLDAAERMDSERDKLAAERHANVLDKLESNRRELVMQMELMIAKSKLKEYEGQQVVPASSQSVSGTERSSS